ncbi:hypothetical protein AGMMS49940_20090 [Spirochaetia bacterium]|nr:hypothetical protein AGMMS49940_20090 [Spirochaetia bacterium]
MKDGLKTVMVTAALAVLFTAVSCGTTGAAASSAATSAQAERTADDQRILDWSNRSIGEIASPVWLLPAVRGNWNLFKQEWPVAPDKVLKIGFARHASLNAAQTVADVQYAARLANQLKQSVLSRAGISLGSDGEFEAVQNAATQAQVSIAGQERVTDFWQLREVDDGNGRKTKTYVYYVVYACDSAVWDQVVAKYLRDIIGQVPDTRAQQTIAGMFNEINAEVKYEREKSEAQLKAEVAAQQQALKQGPQSVSAQREAYRSGDPAKIAAASTTAADTDHVAALALIAAGSPTDGAVRRLQAQ